MQITHKHGFVQILPLILLAGFAVSIFLIVKQTGLQVEDLRSFAKGKSAKKATTAAQAYADKLIAQREKSGSCVGAACLAGEVAQSAKDNPDYIKSLKGSAPGSAGANTLAVLEMTKIASGQIKTTDADAKDAVDYCNAHGRSNCADPTNMATFLQSTNTDLYTMYTQGETPATTPPGSTQVPEAYTSCVKDNSPSECAGFLTSATTPGTIPGAPSPAAVGVTPAVTTEPIAPVTPAVVAANAIIPQPIPASYYSQVDPGWSDQKIPGQNKLFVQAGCGEVTVANILTHAGIPTTPNQAASEIKKDQSGSGTAYSDDIAALTKNGFRSDIYPGSFKNMYLNMQSNDVVWLSVKASDKTYHDIGHHTYIDGYTIVDGKPVYSLRDPFFGNDLKCGADGDRGLSCSSPERKVELQAPPDTNNTGEGTVAVILSPPGM